MCTLGEFTLYLCVCFLPSYHSLILSAYGKCDLVFAYLVHISSCSIHWIPIIMMLWYVGLIRYSLICMIRLGTNIIIAVTI